MTEAARRGSETYVGTKEFGSDPFGGRGRIMPTSDPNTITWWTEIDGQIVTCTDTLIDPVLERNRELFNESYGKRFGDGKIVASVPMSMLYSGYLGDAREARDTTAIKKFLNDPDNERLRTFKGRV